MMAKKYFYIIAAVFLFVAAYLVYQFNILNRQPVQQNNYDENQVKSAVDGFGKALKNVSLLAKPKIVAESIENNYSPFVSQELLLQWTENLQTAPGRLISSPWPDRIEIVSLEKTADVYTITGDILFVTNQDLLEGKFSDKRGITLVVEKKDGRWIITSVALEPVVGEKPNEEIEDGVACTMEAKLCPDGSYVGRTGPNCEFEPCPGE